MPSAKVPQRKRKAAQPGAADPTQTADTPTAVTAPVTEAFAVKCTRKSELIDVDEDIFIDLWGPECDDAQTGAEDSATGFDGTWVWDSDPKSAGRVYWDWKTRQHLPGADSFAGGKGIPITFTSLQAAQAAAAVVFKQMLLAQDRPTRPLLQQLQEQVSGKSNSSSKPKKQKVTKKTAGVKSAAAAAAGKAGEQEALDQLLPQLHSADGLGAWEAKLEWLDDPDSIEARFNNVVVSKLRVEVIRAGIAQ